MRQSFVWFLAGLILVGLLGLDSISLAADGIWIEKADMTTPRFDLSANTVNGKIYVIGGWNKTGKLSTVEEYDPANDAWAAKTDMPTARKGMATCVVNGKIYTFSGSIVVQVNGAQDLTAAVEEYDPVADVWTEKKDMPTTRVGAAAAAVNGKIYVMGGYRPGANTSVVEMYDPEKDIWEKKANIPRGFANGGCASVDGKIYLFGGSSLAGPRSTTYEYDPAADE